MQDLVIAPLDDEGDCPRRGRFMEKNYLRTIKRNNIRESKREHHNKRKGRGGEFDEAADGFGTQLGPLVSNITLGYK